MFTNAIRRPERETDRQTQTERQTDRHRHDVTVELWIAKKLKEIMGRLWILWMRVRLLGKVEL